MTPLGAPQLNVNKSYLKKSSSYIIIILIKYDRTKYMRILEEFECDRKSQEIVLSI